MNESNEKNLSAVALPSSGDVLLELAAVFEVMHFEVQVIGGGSLVLSGSRQLFSEVFTYAVIWDAQQRAFFLVEGEPLPALESQLLPQNLAENCLVVEFQRAPAFGPGGNF